jgi:tRNA-specific 2-thiouridylase
VDSSAAAALLVKEGHTCLGCTMKLYENEDAGISPKRTCCALEDVEDARQAARRLGIPYYVFNFKEEFRREVIGSFVRCYQAGCTPNPCIDCNKYLKFGKLYHRAQELGCDYIATGHYARITHEDGRWHLKKAVHPEKDQSYVLYAMTQDQLAHTLFPLGDLAKSESRAIAQEAGFFNAQKPDSQDICFVPDGDYAAAVERHAGQISPPGPFLDLEGNVLGRHKGIIRYTIGQHRGLGLSLPEKRYVCAIDPARNAVILGPSEALFRRSLTTEAFHWIAGEAPKEPVACTGKIRYRQAEQPAVAYPQPDGTAKIVFDQPQRAITPGQAVVLYQGDEVLGGGVIAGAGEE